MAKISLPSLGSQVVTLGLLLGASIWLGTRRHPDDLTSGDVIGSKDRYTKKGKGSSSDSQIGWWSIEVKLTGFGVTTDLGAVEVTGVVLDDPNKRDNLQSGVHGGSFGDHVFHMNLVNPNMVVFTSSSPHGSVAEPGTALGNPELAYKIGGGTDKDACEGHMLKADFLHEGGNQSAEVCWCVRGGFNSQDDSSWVWDGSYGADCNIGFKHVGCVALGGPFVDGDDANTCTKNEEYDPNEAVSCCTQPATAFAHPIDQDDMMVINVPFLIGGTCMLLAISLGLMLLAEQSDTFNLRKQLGNMLGGELVPMEPLYSYLSAAALALVIFACMLTTLCVMRATISAVVEPTHDYGVSVGEILYLMFFAAVMCTSFFIEVEDRDTRSTVRDLLSAVGGVLACLFFAQIYLEAVPKAEHLMYPMYVGTIVFLAVYITTSAIRSLPLVGGTTVARSVGNLLEDPRVLTTTFALSTLLTAYVTGRHCQNLLDGNGSQSDGDSPSFKIGDIGYQSGLKSDACNFIGTKDARNDKFTFGNIDTTCETGNGSYAWMLYGCWLVPLLVYVGHAVMTRFSQAQQIVNEVKNAANVAAGALQKGGAEIAGVPEFRKSPGLPTRYSRIRVETSV